MNNNQHSDTGHAIPETSKQNEEIGSVAPNDQSTTKGNEHVHEKSATTGFTVLKPKTHFVTKQDLQEAKEEIISKLREQIISGIEGIIRQDLAPHAVNILLVFCA